MAASHNAFQYIDLTSDNSDNDESLPIGSARLDSDLLNGWKARDRPSSPRINYSASTGGTHNGEEYGSENDLDELVGRNTNTDHELRRRWHARQQAEPHIVTKALPQLLASVSASRKDTAPHADTRTASLSKKSPKDAALALSVPRRSNGQVHLRQNRSLNNKEARPRGESDGSLPGHSNLPPNGSSTNSFSESRRSYSSQRLNTDTNTVSKRTATGQIKQFDRSMVSPTKSDISVYSHKSPSSNPRSRTPSPLRNNALKSRLTQPAGDPLLGSPLSRIEAESENSPVLRGMHEAWKLAMNGATQAVPDSHYSNVRYPGSAVDVKSCPTSSAWTASIQGASLITPYPAPPAQQTYSNTISTMPTFAPPTSTLTKFFPRTATQSITALQGHLAKALVEHGTSVTSDMLDRMHFLVAKVAQLPVMGQAQYSPDEDELLAFIKENTTMGWAQIHWYFPQRPTWYPLQTRYSKKLKVRSALPASHPRRERDTSVDMHTSSSSTISIQREHPKRSTRGNLNASTSVSGNLHSSTAAAQLTAQITDDYPASVQSDEEMTSAWPVRPFSRASSRRDISRAWTPPRQDGSNHMPLSTFKSVKPLLPLERLYDEKSRDAAALSSMTTRISRSPVVEQPKTPFHRPSRRKRKSIDFNRPYLDFPARQFLARSMQLDQWNDEDMAIWEGKVVHVDFLDEEIQSLAQSIRVVLRPEHLKERESIRAWISESMKHATSDHIQRISGHVQLRGVFINRTRVSIDSFLRDMRNNTGTNKLSFQRLGLRRDIDVASRDTCLRSRELGVVSKLNGRRASIGLQSAFNMIGPNLSFTGTSGDVTNVAWAPNGEIFAAGSAALTDDHSQQYNQRNNLVIGNVTRKTLRELLEHAILRKKAPEGVNSTREMHISQDPLLFTSISGVEFSPNGEAMFSTGYDNRAKVWDIRGGVDDASCLYEFTHKAPIDLLAVNSTGVVATGSQRTNKGIRVIRYDLNIQDPTKLTTGALTSPRAKDKPASQIMPTCLRFGPGTSQQRYLLCGFSSNAKDYGEGEICIWDVEAAQPTAITRGSRNVFDVAWSPSTIGRFAMGCSPMSQVNRGTNSVVRIYDSRLANSVLYVNPLITMELECPALDMNDIVFNSHDDCLLSVGCTNGATYTWDLRNPGHILHQFSHGNPLMELDESRSREETDTGIRFLSWDQSRRHLYTGSSDGVVALWNPYASPEDAHVANIIQLHSGIMSGAFSPDFSNLLLGEVNGSISMLSVGYEDKSACDFTSFDMQRADDACLTRLCQRLGADDPIVDAGCNLGIEAARELVRSGEIEYQPFGDFIDSGKQKKQAVQSSRYSGPFDKASDAPGLRAAAKNFQARLRPSNIPCPIDHDLPKITEEEQGDSGAWKMRIPERLRWPGAATKTPAIGLVNDQAQKLICFRCHDSQLTEDELEGIINTVKCEQCKMVWRVDVLGYTALAPKTNESVPLTTYSHELSSELPHRGILFSDSDEEDDDLLKEVIDFHHSLWQDRPPSPL